MYAIFAVTAHEPLDRDVAQRMADELTSIAVSIDSPLTIFANNAAIALLMSVPLIGTAAGIYVIYNTGLYVSAIAITTGVPPIALALVPILAIYGALEFFAYGICFNEGIRILLSVIKRELKSQIRLVAYMIGLGVLVLFVAALLEFLILESVQTLTMIRT
ncbi:MAG: hypothetical protein NZ988_01135 [Thaumarchaeota archaeon]|nr:hypothetical protein [Candidatus Calditenuaceae archaeon]MDW8186637.1 hypothetical protein [Nitrososphaerota archaeon]